MPKNGLQRGTGEIPLSWAVPAEAVSDSPARGGGPRGVVIGIVVVVVVVAAAVGLSMRSASTTPAPTSPAPTAAIPAPPPAAPPTPDPGLAAVADVRAVAEADVVEAVADHSDPTPPPVPAAAPVASAGPTDEDRATAQNLISRARIAARDRLDDKALALAERSVEADPACSPCWKTLGFLRARAGDRAGAAVARARADALIHAPDEAPTPRTE